MDRSVWLCAAISTDTTCPAHRGGYILSLGVKGEVLIFLQTRETIGDRQVVSFIQFFLHECGEVTLGHLHIKLPENVNVPIVIVNENDRMPLPLADVPIPQNVKNFKSIRIRLVFTIKFI
jgi:hypothetical protein